MKAYCLRKRLFVFLIALTLVFTMGMASTVTSNAEDVTPAEGSAEWDYSKSKTATKLDSNLESKVTLSLPSAEEQLASEVCFVLDESSFSDTKEKSFELLDALKEQVDKTGAKVQVDIVGFKRRAWDHGSYDLATQ